MSGGRDGRRGDAAEVQKTDPESHLKRGNLQHRHSRKIEKKHISARKLEQMGLGAWKERQGLRLVNARTAKPGMCSSSQCKKLRANIRCIAFPNTFSRS